VIYKGNIQKDATELITVRNLERAVPEKEGWTRTTDLILPLVITVRRKYPYTLLGSVDM